MKFCEEKGLHFVMKADVQEIVATGGKVSGVRLASGAVHPAQVVLAGVGAQCVRGHPVSPHPILPAPVPVPLLVHPPYSHMHSPAQQTGA
jgi:hypothetical protein